VTRQQFEEMTAGLLEETIRITRQTLEEAEQRYPGIRQQISELLLVGGSARMPAVAERLRKEFGWEPRLTDPDLAVAKGAALYAALPDGGSPKPRGGTRTWTPFAAARGWATPGR
jgi:molecular chaperone DnaK (HSP70)